MHSTFVWGPVSVLGTCCGSEWARRLQCFYTELLRETQLLTVYVQGNVTALEEYLSQVELHVANNSARITNLEERVTLEELKSVSCALSLLRRVQSHDQLTSCHHSTHFAGIFHRQHFSFEYYIVQSGLCVERAAGL